MRTPHGIPHGALNEQELAWAGEHGNDYNHRSPGDEEANLHLFARIWRWRTSDVPRTILELGAGTGANVRVLERLFPAAQITAVELNREACEELQRTTARAGVVNASVLDWQPVGRFDLVLTKGLLIHIPPFELERVYRLAFEASKRWILICEYYNPIPMSVRYRGRDDLLWKRDFAGEMLALFPTLKLADYGFVYRRDPHPQDDLTWFLLEKHHEEAAAAACDDPEALNQC